MQVSPYHPSTAGAPEHGAQRHPKLLPQGRCTGHKQEVKEGELGTPGATPIGQVRAAQPLSPCSPPSLPPSQQHNDLRRPQPPGLLQVTDGASSSIWAFVLPQWWGKWEALGSGMRSRPPTHQLQDPGPGWPP